MRALAILSVRNEGAFLLEWLAHHRAIGFTDFLVMSNDCDDGTERMLERLDHLGDVTHIPNPAPHEGGVQWAGLKRIKNHALLKSADWIMVLDIDEFVNIHVGNGLLSDLIAALPDADAIPLTWRLFGNCDVDLFVDQPIVEQFTRAAPKIMHWPWRAAMFKTLYKNNGIYRKPGIHRPKNPHPERVQNARWFDGSGRELPERFRQKQIFSPFGRDNYKLAQLNHYPLGAKQSYIVKSDRGRGVHTNDNLGMSYWVDRNWNIEEDVTISRFDQFTAQLRNGFMADPELSALHQEAVAWRHKRFAELMKDDGPRSLFGRLLLTPNSQPIDANKARYLFRFAVT